MMSYKELYDELAAQVYDINCGKKSLQDVINFVNIADDMLSAEEDGEDYWADDIESPEEVIPSAPAGYVCVPDSDGAEDFN